MFTYSRRRHRDWQGHLRGASVPGGQRGDRLQGREQGEDRCRCHGEARQSRDGQVQHQEGGGRQVSIYVTTFLDVWLAGLALLCEFFLFAKREIDVF